MIRYLFVKDFVLVNRLEIEFQSGLNILTGETGAGKSILVNAIGQLCGERSSPDLVRNGAKKAILEAHFSVRNVANIDRMLADLEVDPLEDDVLIIRKEIHLNGAARVFVNDTPVTLNRLHRLSSLLVDLHGQHQHQQLLHPENHIVYLDAYGKLNDRVREFSALLSQYEQAQKELEQLKEAQIKSFQQQDMYRYQVEELTKAQLNPDELDELKAELKVLSNVETLHQLGASLVDILYSGEINASDLLSQAESDLNRLADLDRDFSPYRDNLEEARATIEEIGRFTEEYLSGLEFNPERMEFIHQRISRLEFLLKKYQKKNIRELIDYHQRIEQLLSEQEQYDDRIQEKEKQIAEMIRLLTEKGEKLSADRSKIAKSFQRQISEVLIKIGMPNARFKVQQLLRGREESPFVVNGTPSSPTARGFDQIVFQLSANSGEDFKPLHKIASGGEISRVMLALKAILADSDQIPILVFDEIDAGISGKIAQRVGYEMSKLAQLHQIICVTHLPQIAAFASAHYKVYKFTEENRTFVDVQYLQEDARIEEIATLLGGAEISDHALSNARHLIKESQTLSL